MRSNMHRLHLGVLLLAAAALFTGSSRAANLELFEFNDANGTPLASAANAINGANLWTESPNMGDSSVASGSYRVIKDFTGLSSNYLQIDNITSGKAYIVAEMANWKFTGFDNAALEQIRFAFLDDDTGIDGNVITAQVQIGRNTAGGIELTGTAIGTAGAANISNVVPLPTEQTAPFTVVLALDKDSESFEVFYKDGSNPSQVLGLGAVSRVRDGNSIRFAVNNNFGSTNFFPDIIDEQFNINRFAVTDTNPFTDLISLEVDRDTGAMTLTNTSGAAISAIEGISILSDVGALDASQWKSVTNHYDGNSGGDVDSDDNWGIDSATPFELSESMLAGGPGDGGALAINQIVEFDIAPGAAPGTWVQSPFEDIRMELTLAGGATRTVDVNFTGNGGAKWAIGDLNFDTEIDEDDWLIFISHAEEDLSSYSLAEAYQRGDLDGDGINSVVDFGLFKNAYEAANGGGSFDAMLAGVPEPNSFLLACFVAVGLATVRRESSRR